MLDLPVGASGTQIVVEKCHGSFGGFVGGFPCFLVRGGVV
jgi:hypothetical protein